MPAKCFFASLFIVCSTWGSASKYIKTSPDSLKMFSNLRIQAKAEIINEDSLYCDKLRFETDTPLEGKDTALASRYLCKDSQVTEFTFFGYRDGFVRLLYKPTGSKDAYFGKAEI